MERGSGSRGAACCWRPAVQSFFCWRDESAGCRTCPSPPRHFFFLAFNSSRIQATAVFGDKGGQKWWPSALVVVEGFFDCLRVHQAGFRNVVALMEASLSEVQEKLLLERFA
jgi:Toprim domain